MTKKLLFFSMLVCFAFSTTNTSAQVSAFNIGWNASHFFTPLKNLQNDIDNFNTTNPQMEKFYELPQWFQGLYIDYRIGSPEGGMIMGWNNKHGIAEAEGIATGDTESKLRKIKVRLNTFNWGGYFSLYRRLKMGITADFGTFKVNKKIATPDDFQNADWEPHYNEKGMFTIGGTVNISYGIPLGKTMQLRIQPYAQYTYLISKFTFNENKYFYNPSTFGVNTFFSFLWGK